MTIEGDVHNILLIARALLMLVAFWSGWYIMELVRGKR